MCCSRKVLVWKLMPQYDFKMATRLIERQRAEGWNPKMHMPLVILLLWHKMVAVCCFVWPPALQMCSGKQKFELGRFV